MILVTTLLSPEVYRVTDLAELYRRRWQVETALAHRKTTMQMEVLHSKTVLGVLKELTVFAIVYNLVRLACANQPDSNTPPWSGSASWMLCGGSARHILACR
jgi:IS4 transposase